MSTQLEKEEILLKWLKETIPTLAPEDDFWDSDLFNEQVTAFFLTEWVEPEIDINSTGKFRLLVETEMFGGSWKHLDMIEWERQKDLKFL